ncbi:MAG: chorismate mutase [archaeon]
MPLEEFRKKIDALDETLLETLAKRMQVSSEIGAFKKKNGIAFKDPEREKQLIASRRKLAEKLGLSPVFAEKLFRAILGESLKIQKQKNKPKQ